MTRSIVALAVAVFGLALTGCGPDTKATIPTQMGPALGDDSPAGGESGGKQKGGKGAAKKSGGTASDG